MHNVSGIDQPHTHASVARRGYIGVIEIGLRGFNHGRIGIDRCFELIHGSLLTIDVLLAFNGFEHQRLKPREILFGRC